MSSAFWKGAKMEKPNYRANMELIKDYFPDVALLTINQTAKFLNVSQRTIYRLIDRGELRCVETGSNFKRISVTDLANWLS